MKAKNLIVAAALLGSWSTYSKVFNFRNAQTGQTMSVSCFFPNSVQCQNKIAEVRERLTASTNPSSTTLTSARAADAAGIVANDAAEFGGAVRDSISSGVDSTVQFGREVGQSVSNTVAAARGQTYKVRIPGIEHTMSFHCHGGLESEECVSEKNEVVDAIRAGSTSRSLATHRMQPARDVATAVSDSAVAATDATIGFGHRVGQAVSETAQTVRGKNYRLRVPGIDHTMTFHCRGGLESDECQSEKDAVTEAIRAGSMAATLAEHRTQPARDVVASVADTTSELALSVGRTVRNGFGQLNHGFCERKLENFASDFDDSYRQNGSELVSYEVKMEYIREQLEEGGNFQACEEHYNTAVLGYQLRWAAGGSTDLERTHIFDGLGRLANGDMGYWKNEVRAEAPSAAQR